MKLLNELWPDKELNCENFKNPPLEMGILPFWFWNGEMDEAEMEWQLKEYKAKGITGLFIHGRFGLKIPYLSEKWFERVKFAVKKGREIGLNIWIYDEMNWPSGTAERQVIKKYPYLSQKYLEMVTLFINGPLFIYLEATDSRYINTGDSKPIAAYICSAEEYRTGIKNIIDVTPNLSFNKVIPWEAPAGNWVLMYFLEKEIDYYIDALNPEATKRFIELTHEQYKTAVGAEFGKIVPGFYTDEPAMHYFQVGTDNYVIPWSQRMFKIFRERNGYSIKPHLAALYANVGRDTARIRYDFWKTLSDQYDDSYYKQLRDWCAENGVLFTGHILFENWLRGHARCEGNVMQHLSNLHLTGVDHLYPKIGSEEQPGEHVELKMASSITHHLGKKRLLCESMGGTYWDCTLERMKWIANWEYSLGVNLFNNHGYHYSIEGERKRDWPPSQFYHHTWWKYYNEFTHYMARLGHALTGGKHIAKILILYPITSIWANYVPQAPDDISRLIEMDFNYLTDALLHLHYDFDYVDEDILINAQLNGNRLEIADESYELIILPPVTHIKKATLDKIKAFVNNGGKIIADILLPVEQFIDGKPSKSRAVDELFGVKPNCILADFQSGKNEVNQLKMLQPGVCLIQGGGLAKDRRRKDIKEAIESCITADVQIGHSEVFYLHRVKDGRHLFYFVNTLQQDIGEVDISLETVGRPELWDPATGAVKELSVFDIINNRLCFRLTFGASQTFLVILHNDLPDSYISATNLVIEKTEANFITGYLKNGDLAKLTLKTGGKQKDIVQMVPKNPPPLILPEVMNFKIENDNTLCLAKWKMLVSNECSNDNYAALDYDDDHWLPVTIGAWEMQLPEEPDDIHYPQTLWYRIPFQIEELPNRVKLLIDGFSGSSFRLFINGTEVKDTGQRSQLDAEIREINIHSYVHPGRNLIAVQLVVQRRTDGILDLIKITGDFALKLNDDGYSIVLPKKEVNIGDWCQQGYPYFSGTGTYSTELTIPADFCKGKLFLDIECGEDVLELQINDSGPIIVPWHPYQIDITDLVRPGKNTFRFSITNTLINTLEAVPKSSGLLKPPVITNYQLLKIKID